MNYEYDDIEGCSRCGIDLPKGKYIPWGSEKLCPDCIDSYEWFSPEDTRFYCWR